VHMIKNVWLTVHGYHKIIIAVCATISIVLVSIIPPFDTDLGWHLRYGSYFWDNFQVLRTNELTYFLHDYTWSHSYSIYQAITFVLYKIGGLEALMVGYGFLIGILYIVFGTLFKNSWYVSTLAFILFLWIGLSTLSLGWRAQVFSLLCFMLVFLILRSSHSIKRILLLGVLFVFWVNFHGGFVIGLAVVGFDFVSQIYTVSRREKVLVSIGLAVSVFATFINPFGWGVYEEILNHLQTPMHLLVAEWVGPSTLVQVIYIGLSFLWIWILYTSNHKRKYFWSMCVLFVTYLSISALRHGVYMPLIFFVSVADVFTHKLIMLNKQEVVHISAWVLVVGGFLIGIFSMGPAFNDVKNWDRYCTQGLRIYPCEIIEYLTNSPLPSGSHLYTLFEWGGFLSWQLPEYTYFVDGRMPAWKTDDGVSPYTTYLEIIQAKDGFSENLVDYGTEYLLIANGTFLDIRLSEGDMLWRELYRDKTAVIYQSDNK